MAGLLCMVFVLVIQRVILAQESETCSALWADTVRSIKTGSQPEFKAAVDAFAISSKNTYTLPELDNITGWTLKDVRDPEYGMHAVVYQNDQQSRRILVAVRGTNLDGSIGSQCDRCAGWFLTREGVKPDYCGQFSDDEIDYVGQLKTLIDQLLHGMFENVTSPCLALTGHSLGATVTSVFSANSTLDTVVIGFSGGGQIRSLEVLGLNVSGPEPLNIFNQYDPIVQLPSFCQNQLGYACMFHKPVEGDACPRCYREPDLDLSNLTSPCGVCFLQTHWYRTLLDSIYVNNLRPVCVRRDTEQSSNPFCRPAYVNAALRVHPSRDTTRYLAGLIMVFSFIMRTS